MNKKLATVAALLTATASTFTLVACGGGEDTLNLQASDAKTTEYVESVLQATEKAPTGVGEISLSASAEGSSSYFLCKADGEKIESALNNESSGSATVTASGWWNQDGEVDLKAHYAVTDEETNEGYAFAYLRGGYLMFNASETETIDLNTVELTAVNISELISEIISMPMPEVEVSGSVSFDAIAKLALSYGSVSVSNGTIELDIDRTVASLVKDVLQTVGTINAETTLGSVLQSNAVKNVVNSLFSKYTAKQFRAEIMSLLGVISPESAQAIDALLPQPAETDETVHDYLMTLINDKNLSGMLLMYINPTLTNKTIAEVTFGDLLGDKFESVIEKIKQAVVMEYVGGALTLNIAVDEGTVTLSLKDVAIKFTVNSSNCITAVDINCGTFSVESSMIVYDEYADSYNCNKTSFTGSCVITINMNSNKTITDISNVNTNLGATVGELLNPVE